MKMRFLSMAALAMVGAVMTGCSKDDSIIDNTQQPEDKDNVVTLTTTVGFEEEAPAAASMTRALATGGVKTFAAGETMALVYKNKSGSIVKAVSTTLTAGDITNGGKNATFTFTLTNPDTSLSVTYIYPAAMAKSDGTVNYDALATQDGTLATLASKYDLATSTASWNGTSLPSVTLYNRLAVCALTLKNSNGSSVITSSLKQVSVSTGTNTYFVKPASDTFSQDIIYVAIRPVTTALWYTASNGSTNYVKTATSRQYAAGNLYNLGLRMTELPAGALSGEFTIDKSKATRVRFAQGNLQATNPTAKSTSGWIWSFAAHQYDYIGNAPGNTNVSVVGTVDTKNVTVDLFGWVGKSSSWTGAGQYGICIVTTDDLYGNVASEALKSDWGNTIGTGWRTLTKDEWWCLFKTRTTTSGKHYAKATVNGQAGVILLPDNWSINYYSLSKYDTAEATYSTNSINLANWNMLEAIGCVFLPAAGYRDGASVVTNYGRYWSSTSSTDATNAYNVSFANTGLEPNYQNPRHSGFSVRLVRSVE